MERSVLDYKSARDLVREYGDSWCLMVAGTKNQYSRSFADSQSKTDLNDLVTMICGVKHGKDWNVSSTD